MTRFRLNTVVQIQNIMENDTFLKCFNWRETV